MNVGIFPRDGLWHVEQDGTTVYSTPSHDEATRYWWNLLHPSRRSGRAPTVVSATPP